MNILVCDDDHEIAKAIEIYLRNEGYDVLLAANGAQAVSLCREKEVHLVLMDLMMPVMDGMQATKLIRESKDIPIIMLTAKSEDYDKITGLNIGADDYVTKPFNPLELIARVRAQLRRYTDFGKREEKAGIYRSGGLVIDDVQKTVTAEGNPVAVTPIEFGILKLLTQNAGRVFSMEQIYEAVWNEPAFNPENTVAVHIRRIRKKSRSIPGSPDI